MMTDARAERDAQVAAAVRRVRAGDVEAYADVVRAYSERLLAYLRARGPDPSGAEDLAQVVFVAAFEGLPRFDESRDFGAWLFGIAANQLRKAWAKAGREQRHLAAFGEQTRAALADWAAEGGADAADQLGALQRCVAELPDRWRDIVRWHYEEGWTLARIAEALGNAPSTVGVTLYRVRGRLRECIERRLAAEGRA